MTISNWILDSGASVHITKSLNLLSNIQTVDEKIALPNGKLISSTFRGQFTGFINDNKISLKNVYYVPDITKNIISVTQLIKQHCKIIFLNHNNKMYCTIYNQHGNRIVNIYPNNQNIFNIWMTSKVLKFDNKISPPNMSFMHLSHLSKSNKINLWRRRLGHYSINNIKNKLLKIDIKSKCPICSHSKLRNSPYKRAKNKSKSIFELVHMDLVGPVDDPR